MKPSIVAAFIREVLEDPDGARELAEELEARDAPAAAPPSIRGRRERGPRAKPTAQSHEKAARALERGGVYPAGEWKR